MKKLLTALAVSTQVYLLFPLLAKAEDTSGFSEGLQGAASNLETIGTETGTQSDLTKVIGQTINVVLGVLGILFVVLVVYAGILYLTSQGEDTNVKKAKKLLTQAVMGLVIVVAAYAISNFVLDALTASVQK